jgi:sugar transferase (PEP-CTERM/EpsH1 system associated)
MPRRRRVIHVAQNLDMGGLERLLVQFARRIDRTRFDLHFVLLGEAGLLADEVRAAGWPVTALHQGEGFRPLLYARLAWLFVREQAEVVHTHDERPLIYAAPAARLARVRRVIHTRHRGADPELNPRQAALLRFASARVDAFVCVSAAAAEASRKLGVPGKSVRVLLNGIDLETFRPAGADQSITSDYAATGPTVIVARLTPEKDLATLLEAVALVVRRVPTFRLLIAGDGPCRADLEAQAARLGLAEHVVFLGIVRDIPPLLAGARLFVLSSRSEGISLTLLEAMASGLPIVATRVGGNPEVVADGVTGLLVPSGNPAALAKTIVALYLEPRLAAEMGRAGRERVEEHFDLARMIRAYEKLYSE